MRIRSRLALGFGGQVLLTVALGLGAFAALDSANQEFTFVAEHRSQVMAHAQHLAKLVVDMETGQRGFCITGEDAFLEPYTSGWRSFRALLATEIGLVEGEPEKVALLETVGRLVDMWRRAAAEPEIAMARRVATATARAHDLRDLLATSPGEVLMARIIAAGRALEGGFLAQGDWQGAFAIAAIKAWFARTASDRAGFVATGDGLLLQQYDAAVEALPGLFATLRGHLSTTALGEGRAGEVDALEELIQAWVAHAAEPQIAARMAVNAHPESHEDVAALLRAETGKRLIDEIRRTLDAFIAAEAADARADHASAQRTADATVYGIALVFLVSIGLGSWLAWDTGRVIAQPIARLVQGAERIAQGDLAARVALEAVGEVQDLGDAFDTMAQRLERAAVEKEHAEAALYAMRSLESLGTLAGGIAHDFNNILTGILGNLSLLEAVSEPTGEVGEIIVEARNAALTATGLTRQLLTFAKGGEPMLETIEPGPLLVEVCTFATRGSKTKCVFTIADDLHAVRVDPGQIAQVLQNLVLNAVQAMPDGGTIQVSACNVDTDAHGAPSPEGGLVHVSVADGGEGIAADVRAKIFDPYFSTKADGQGLGLAMSHSIVTKHGGTITVQSQLRAGTTFTFTLPAARSDALRYDAPPGAAEVGSGRVLVMDDDDTVSSTAVRILTRLGYSCEVAPDGHRALDVYVAARASGRPFDAVIMDLTIPGGMGGKEAVLKLKSVDPDARAIVSSGYSDDPVMADHARYGFDGVLTKPYTLGALAEALASVA